MSSLNSTLKGPGLPSPFSASQLKHHNCFKHISVKESDLQCKQRGLHSAREGFRALQCFQAEVSRHTLDAKYALCFARLFPLLFLSLLNTESESDSDSHQLNCSSREAGVILSPSGATAQHHNTNVLRHEAKSIAFMGSHLEGQLRTVFPAAQIVLEYKNKTSLFSWKTWQKSR